MNSGCNFQPLWYTDSMIRILMLAAMTLIAASTAQSASVARLLDFQGAIGPAVTEAVERAIADDIPQLLHKLDGRTVATSQGNITLHTQAMIVEQVERNWRSRLLGVISDPNIAYILMLLGVYGLFFELANPGFVLPGVIGGISLLLALFAFQVLPINMAGLGLIGLGIAFMIAEAFVPSFGVLGLGGVIAFGAGSVMLMDASVPGYGISMALIGSLSLLSALLFILIGGMAAKARKRPVVSGAEELSHDTGIALESFEHSGHVQVHGETWQAKSDQPVHQGDAIRVIGRDGLILEICTIQHKTTEVPS